MELISSDIRNFVNYQKLGYVATVSADNTPNLSPKGTIVAIDESHLAFADIRSPQTIENLRQNSSIEINVVDPIHRKDFVLRAQEKLFLRGRSLKKF